MIDRLRASDLFGDQSEDRLAWLAELGTTASLPAGAVVARQGDPAGAFCFILEGRVRWTRRVGGREVHAVTLGPGEVFAELILILGQAYPTTGTAVEPTALLQFGPEAFWQMLGTCPGVLRKVTRIAVQRAEIHETVAQQQARLVGLGQVAAGLAHELGNPTSALVRAGSALDAAVAVLAGPSPEQPAAGGAGPGPLERADREEALRERLLREGRPDADELAAVLAASGADPAEGDDLGVLAARLQLHALTAEIQAAADRIATLVEATKVATDMDHAADRDPVDVAGVVRSALAMLGPGGVQVTTAGPPPVVLGSAGDLAQLVVELVRNAREAGSRVTIGVAADPAGWVDLSVEDDGPGVAPEAADRIFEPFFTTRGAAGTGLGLHRARRIAEQHDGQLLHLGGSRFLARLPAATPEEVAPAPPGDDAPRAG